MSINKVHTGIVNMTIAMTFTLAPVQIQLARTAPQRKRLGKASRKGIVISALPILPQPKHVNSKIWSRKPIAIPEPTLLQKINLSPPVTLLAVLVRWKLVNSKALLRKPIAIPKPTLLQKINLSPPATLLAVLARLKIRLNMTHTPFTPKLNAPALMRKWINVMILMVKVGEIHQLIMCVQHFFGTYQRVVTL